MSLSQAAMWIVQNCARLLTVFEPIAYAGDRYSQDSLDDDAPMPPMPDEEDEDDFRPRRASGDVFTPSSPSVFSLAAMLDGRAMGAVAFHLSLPSNVSHASEVAAHHAADVIATAPHHELALPAQAGAGPRALAWAPSPERRPHT